MFISNKELELLLEIEGYLYNDNSDISLRLSKLNNRLLKEKETRNKKAKNRVAKKDKITRCMQEVKKKYYYIKMQWKKEVEKMNNVIIVGRIVREPKNEEICIAVPRSFKNEDGIYETDFLTVHLPEDIVKKTNDYLKKGDLKKGDLVGIKGWLQGKKDKMEIVVGKITFLSRKGKE